MIFLFKNRSRSTHRGIRRRGGTAGGSGEASSPALERSTSFGSAKRNGRFVFESPSFTDPSSHASTLIFYLFAGTRKSHRRPTVQVKTPDKQGASQRRGQREDCGLSHSVSVLHSVHTASAAACVRVYPMFSFLVHAAVARNIYNTKECTSPAHQCAPTPTYTHTLTHTLTIVINQSFLLNNNVQTHENAHERIRLRQPNPSDSSDPLHPTRPTKKESKRQKKKKIRLCKQDLETSTGKENRQTGKQMRHANRQGGR